MSKPAIRVEGLSKLYRIGKRERYRTLRDSITAGLSGAAGALRRMASRNGTSEEQPEFWALRDVSFEVQPGEVIGIIGRNGAGKSTLLKILSRVTEPTTGFAEIHGRVGSLLEVGTGFHPELTGRENIYLNGAILGMKRAEISAKFDEILAFAEVERFIDTPVKHYSSGMYLRLAFSVAAHLEPEILLVDEVLAVGDAEFRKKCLGKMENVAREGRTVLFVSHNMSAIKSLCQRALCLGRGMLLDMDRAGDVVDRYSTRGVPITSEQSWPRIGEAPGTPTARIVAVRLLDFNGDLLAGPADISKPLTLVVDYVVIKPNTTVSISLSLTTPDEVYVLSSPSICGAGCAAPVDRPGYYRSSCVVPANLLNECRYTITVLLVERARHIIVSLDRVLSFDAADLGEDSVYFGYWGGVVRPQLVWQTRQLADHMEVECLKS